jgi:hypothetical protein
MPSSPIVTTLLEKAARDNGFDRELPRDGSWLGFTSSHARLSIWLTARTTAAPIVAVSRDDVAAELGVRVVADVALPPGAVAAHAPADMTATHALLRRAFQLAQSLPNGLLERYQAQTAALPRTTEAERLVVERVGQDLFRGALLDYWQGRCAVTGLAVPELLRASHIKPWVAATDAERLDLYNGLLLAPNLDAAFDRGLMTVLDDGSVRISGLLSRTDRAALGIGDALAVSRLTDRHRAHLAYHRANVFRSGN